MKLTKTNNRDWIRIASAMSMIALVQACADGSSKPIPVPDSPPTAIAPAAPQAKTLQLRGRVSDAARLKDAAVVVQAAATTYNTTVAADGSYAVTLKSYAATDFVTVRIKGAGSASALEFFSLAGTVGALETLGGNDGSVDGLQAHRLVVSSTDTARAGLIALRRSQAAFAKVGTTAKVDNTDSPVQRDEELKAEEAGLDPQEVNQVATLIQVVADNPGIPPPQGGTYRFAQQPGTRRAEYAAQVQRDFPRQVEQSSSTVAASETPALTDADVPPQFLMAISGPNEKYSSLSIASNYRFNTDKTGSLRFNASTNASVDRQFTWQVSDNSLRLSFPALAGTQFRDVNGNGDRFEEGEEIQSTTKEDHQLFFGEKDANGITSVTYKQRRQIRFPNKEVPDEDFTLTRAGFGVNDGAPSPAALHFNAGELNGRRFAMDSSSRLDAGAMPMSDSTLRSEDRTRRGDVLTFNAGGSGSSLVLGSFTWSIGDGTNSTAQGELRVVYANGDIARYAKFRALQDGVQLIRRYFDSANGGTAYRVATAGLMLEVDAAAKLDVAKLAGVYHFNGVGSSGASEVHSSITWQLGATGQSVETHGSSFKLDNQPGGELRFSSSPIHRYSLSADGRRLLAVSTFDNKNNPGCDLASSNCSVSNHRELHILKIIGNSLYVRVHETTPTRQESSASRGIVSSILRIDFEPATNQGTAPPAGEAGFVNAAEVAAAYAAAEFSADGDFIDSISPSPRDSTLTYPSSGNCSAGGSFTTTADSSTAFNKDGILSGSNCQTSDGNGGVALLNGQIATQCVDSAQTTTACQQFNASYGTASQRLNAVASDGDYLSSLLLNVRSNSNSTGSTRTFNGGVQTKPSGATQGATLTLNYANFEGSYRDAGLVVAGSLAITSSNPANCYTGKATYATNTPVSESGSGPGNVRVRDVNGGAGTVVFKSDGTVAVLFEGSTKTYTREQLSNLCN